MTLRSLVIMFQQVGTEEAERFCKAFQQIHKRLVRLNDYHFGHSFIESIMEDFLFIYRK
jgi:hypothetical protein